MANASDLARRAAGEVEAVVARRERRDLPARAEQGEYFAPGDFEVDTGDRREGGMERVCRVLDLLIHFAVHRTRPATE